MTSREIRQQFLDFFTGKQHTIVPSASVVPVDDPTLMFTNAGMNQFKPIFLGQQRPDLDKWPGVISGMPTRAADTQKCIRAGGKHNDLDDVGQDTYHHTLFEMLGNGSFGDYFKKEAIEWAWELLTGVWGIEKDRLYATYFEGDQAEGLEADDEAARLWTEVTDIDPTHVVPGDRKDNFWEMGDTGPCGPCSEIHIDLTPDKTGCDLVNAGDHRVIEIWNLVFIQFNRAAGGKLTPLPAQHVDTGMGFERLCAVLQGMEQDKLGQVTNYDTDVFTPIFAAIQQRTAAPPYCGTLPGDELRNAECGMRNDDAGSEQIPHSALRTPHSNQIMIDVSYRVIADHLRCLTFALTDGAIPDRDGRGYVLRRILRRAVFYGQQHLHMQEPFLCDLVQPLVDHMADAFPELRTAHNGDNVRRVAEIIREEEGSFLETLERGRRIFGAIAIGCLAAKKYQSRDPSKTYLNGLIHKTFHDSGNVVVFSWRGWEDLSPPNEVFEETLQTGQLVTIVTDDVLEDMKNHPERIPGRVAFMLHDTYGFPVDLTQLMAEEGGLTVDIQEYERLMEEARDLARGSTGQYTVEAVQAVFTQRSGETLSCDESPKYDRTSRCSAVVTSLGWNSDSPLLGYPPPGTEIVLSTDRTCFYSEQGGQVSDKGTARIENGEIEITSVYRHHDRPVHRGVVRAGKVILGSRIELEVEWASRWPTMQNHTSTHILNWALREVLGQGVQQKGSLVDPEKTRFDFSHRKPVTPEELERIEALANRQIEAKHAVYAQEVDQAQALRINTLRAVFGEKYPERVRVVSIGAPIGDEANPDADTLLGSPDDPKWMQYSVEFCGGTHLKNSGEADRFVLISEEGVAKGIRRVVGVSGERARQAIEQGNELIREADDLTQRAALQAPSPVAFSSSRGRSGAEEAPHADAAPRGLKSAARHEADLSAEVASLQRKINEAVIPVVVRHQLRDKLAELQRIAKAQAKRQSAKTGRSAMEQAAALLESAETVNGVTIVTGRIDDAPPDALRGAIDWIRNKTPASAVLLASVSAGKVILVAGMSDDAVARGVKAGDLVREIAPLVGGKGGGKPSLAQAGGKDPEAIPQALDKARERLGELLS